MSPAGLSAGGRSKALDRIVPGKMSGEPHLAGSRITTQVAAALHEHIPDAGRIAGLYAGLDVRMFEEAIEFEHSLAA